MVQPPQAQHLSAQPESIIDGIEERIDLADGAGVRSPGSAQHRPEPLVLALICPPFGLGLNVNVHYGNMIDHHSAARMQFGPEFTVVDGALVARGGSRFRIFAA